MIRLVPLGREESNFRDEVRGHGRATGCWDGRARTGSGRPGLSHRCLLPPDTAPELGSQGRTLFLAR